MFVSADYLAINYGVHDSIAKFFADREPPINNLYWKDKLMYLRPEPASLFIPAMVDTLYKIGIPKEEVLGDSYIHLMEQIGHIAAMEEANQLTQKQAVDACIELIKNNYKNNLFYTALVNYMQGGSDNFIAKMVTPFNALHRGDIFLFSVCILNFDDIVATKIVEYWFALISSFLLMDDADDLEVDKKNNHENAFLQSGLDLVGINKIKNLLSTNLKILKTINTPLARTIDTQFVKMAELPHIKQYLN